MSDNDPSNQFAGVSDCPKEQEFECPECGAIFNYPGNLNPLESYREHLETEHPDTNPLRSTHKALVEDHDFYQCKQCGEKFDTKAEREAHSHPKKTPTERAKTVGARATTTSKKASVKAASGGKRGFVYLFDEKGEVTAVVAGILIGILWGHDPLQAYTVLGAASGIYLGGVGSSAKSGVPIPREKLAQLGKNTLQLFIGFGLGVGVIIIFHDDPNAPEWWYQILDYVWHLFGVHNSGAH